MNISNKSFEEVKEISKTKEGLVFLGCGGHVEDWEKGIKESIQEHLPYLEFKKDFEDLKVFEDEILVLKTTGGRIDLLFVFDKDFDPTKLAIWRIKFGDCSWLSDYIVNYASHF